MSDTSKIISLQELMAGRNADFDKTTEIRILRLSENNPDLNFDDEDEFSSIHDLYIRNKEKFKQWLSVWSNEKNYKAVLRAKYIVVMISEDGMDARLASVYKVIGTDTKKYNDKKHHLILEDVEGFDALNGRVIVEWNGFALSWNQWWYADNNVKNGIQYKYVIRIDDGIQTKIPPFTSYEDVILSFSELEDIIRSGDSMWKSKLEAVNCIYCIADKENGKLYIGSTYSNEDKDGGIWNRWSRYVETEGNGDNKDLEKLSPQYIRKNLQWSIL